MKTLQNYAMAFIGQPYIFGGNNPVTGFDCSGLVSELLRSVGEIGRDDFNAQALFSLYAGQKRTLPASAAPSLGCLVFFGKDEKSISHVAFVLDSFRMLEAGGGDATTLTPKDAGARNAFTRIRPIKARRDLVGFACPEYAYCER